MVITTTTHQPRCLQEERLPEYVKDARISKYPQYDTILVLFFSENLSCVNKLDCKTGPYVQQTEILPSPIFSVFLFFSAPALKCELKR